MNAAPQNYLQPTGTITYPGDTGLKVITIRHPSVMRAFAILEGGTRSDRIRHNQNRTETEQRFIRRAIYLGTVRAHTVVCKIFLPLRLPRVRLEE
jgi:hypothetical protein